jgi:hypothetical protein
MMEESKKYVKTEEINTVKDKLSRNCDIKKQKTLWVIHFPVLI